MADGGSPSAFSFRPAVRENTPMVMALAGASGSGKTFTALELAMGLAGDGGKIAVIDTEGRRALHYADLRDDHGEIRFRFDHCELRPPFSPDRFLAAMQAAERAGYRVIVIDSFSDEHEGEGGLIDMAAAGTNPNSAANWARPKAMHKLIVRWLRQTRCHVLFCLRAEERVRLERVFDEKKGREVNVVVPLGWVPVCEKRFMFDMTASFLLDPAHPGIPQPIKLQEQHRRFFPAGECVTRASGHGLAEWADGGMVSAAPSLADRGREAAALGSSELRRFWEGLSRADQRDLKPLLDDELKAAAAAADARSEPQPHSPGAGAEPEAIAGGRASERSYDGGGRTVGSIPATGTTHSPAGDGGK